MRLNDLKAGPGSRPAKKRVGRGTSSGIGKTGGRGVKGQTSRTGSSIRPGFEGGQMPLKQRVPKLKGFNNPFRVEYSPVNLHQLDKLGASSVTPESLVEAGLIRKGAFVKILAHGSISSKVDVTAHAVSESARAAIEAAGGSVTLVELPFKAEGRAGRPAVKGNQFANR